MVKNKPVGWKNESVRHSLARKGIKTGRKKQITITTPLQKQTKYISKEGFEFQFEPLEDTLTVEQTKDGYVAKYLIRDEMSESPNDWGDESLFLVHYHRDFEIKRDSVITEDDARNIYQGKKISQEKNYWIFPVDAYIHSGVSLSMSGGFRGKLSEGHEQFDVSSVGLILVSKKEAKTKKQAEKTARYLLQSWNEYLSGDVYSMLKQTYNKKGKNLDYDIVAGNYGFENAKKDLKTEM